MRFNKTVSGQRPGQYIKTATLRIINVPSYFIMELIASFSRQKTSERIINEFIFQNTGSIRKHGNDEVQKLITKHNIQQVEQNKYS
ncbi:hypothetical protein CMU89_07690 [Elizabethkingia anophelis]|nr:hypothetical protein [Elizabethkingia anophelis]MDV3542536.1 hypothetical protein [Elizabethkingia anophelis]